MRLKYEKVIHHAVVNNLFGLRYMKKSCNAQGSSKYYLFVTASFFAPATQPFSTTKRSPDFMDFSRYIIYDFSN